MGDRDPLALWTEAASALDRLLTTMRNLPGPSGEGAQEAVAALTQGYLTALSAGLRCTARLARACEAHRSELAGLVFGGADRERLSQLLRALAAELGDGAVQEAERFRNELRALAEGFAAAPLPAPHPQAEGGSRGGLESPTPLAGGERSEGRT